MPVARDYTVHVRSTIPLAHLLIALSGVVGSVSGAASTVTGTVYYDATNTANLVGGVCTGTGSALPTGGASGDLATIGGARSGGALGPMPPLALLTTTMRPTG